MPFHPYIVREVPPGPRQPSLGSRYAVEDAASGRALAKFSWREAAEQEARRLNVDAGACPGCSGDGSVLLRYAGSTPVFERCENCRGAGRETEAGEASGLQPAA
jgi:hypothetical protein